MAPKQEGGMELVIRAESHSGPKGLAGPRPRVPKPLQQASGLGPASSSDGASPRAGFWEVWFISSLVTVYKLKNVCLASSLGADGRPQPPGVRGTQHPVRSVLR